MARIETGRMTHQHDGDLVVFLIGMTINKPWRPDLWVPVFAAMPPMIKELAQDPDSGMLGSRVVLEGYNPLVIQYWESVEKLYEYASDRTARHRPAWTAFNRRARTNPGAVGIWHETFVVSGAETFYGSTPELGLAKATNRVPITRNAARDRLAA